MLGQQQENMQGEPGTPTGAAELAGQMGLLGRVQFETIRAGTAGTANHSNWVALLGVANHVSAVPPAVQFLTWNDLDPRSRSVDSAYEVEFRKLHGG